ncbi:FKBP-type peptidyl-prolyl cis-trans isomerase [Sphingobacterium spiritivorum]|uniref:FKBP-type peptidyl-prolyl cis-trans isomerase n=1 Tax=Sphingobacterium spiritivorum TaxID=258 RepID=UPI003DA3721C
MTAKSLGKLLIIGLATISLFASCIKDDDVFNDYEQYQKESVDIQNYIRTNFPTAKKDTTGIWFELIEEGEGENFQYKTETVSDPNTGQSVVRALAPTVTVKFTGKLLSGSVVQNNQTETGIAVSLAQQPASWQLAFLPYEISGVTTQIRGLTRNGLKTGSIIRFVTPSYYAYGNMTVGQVPANSPLDYTIEVIKMEYKDSK